MKEKNASLIKWASEQATSLLSPLGNRWLHVQGVAERALCIKQALNEDDYAYLLASAYVHDIGYAPSLKKTGFHPLDGAYYLQSCGQEHLASLVAHHSEAQYEAQLRDLLPELDTFPRECSPLTDALTYCDMTTNPIGTQVSFEERLADIFSRYDETSIVNQAIHRAAPALSLAVIRTQQKLKANGSIGTVN